MSSAAVRFSSLRTPSSWSLSGLLASIVLVAVTLLVSPPSYGQCYTITSERPYRIHDLGRVGGANDLQMPPFGDLTFGINSCGQVAFFGHVDPTNSSSNVRIKVYLPIGVFNFSTQGVYDLHDTGADNYFDPALPGGYVNAAGTDINDDGMVVGLAGADILNAGVPVEAWLFKLNQTTLSGSDRLIPNESLHPSSVAIGGGNPSTNCYSTAHCITNSSPPAVAGVVGLATCNAECDSFNPRVGFTHVLGGSYQGRAVSGGSRDAATMAVNDAVTRIAIGWDEDTYDPEICDSSDRPTPCVGVNSPSDGLRWSGSSSTPTDLTEVDAGSSNAGRTVGRDVHSDGSAVGYSTMPFGIGQDCTTQATFWDASNVVTNLSSVYTLSTDDTRADAIRDAEGGSDVRVAGANVSNGFGLLWTRVGGTWCAYEIDDLTWSPPGFSTSFGHHHVIAGHDINQWGHIVAYGSVPGDSVEHAFILTCASDLTGDYRVDGADLGVFLSAAPCSSCTEDLDGDHDADSGDLGILLAGWHEGENDCDPCTIAMPEAAPLFRGGDMTLEEALLAMGFESFAAFDEWGDAATITELTNMGRTLSSLLGGS